MNQNLQPSKYNDHQNHQCVLTYCGLTREVDYLKSDAYLKEVMNDMLREHRDIQLKKILNNEDI